MKVCHYESIPAQAVEKDGARGCRVRWLVDASDGAPNFAMRYFEIAPGGVTPRHSHDYEHEVFVLDGEGVVYEGDQEHPLRTGDVIYVAPQDVHQFRNTGDAPLKFICLVPNWATQATTRVAPECGVLPAAANP